MTGSEGNAINWTAQQLRLFTRMYKFMKDNQAHFTRESAPRIDRTDWSVISRMAALYAAHNIDDAVSGETRPAALE
jgi:hypothetical protein